MNIAKELDLAIKSAEFPLGDAELEDKSTSSRLIYKLSKNKDGFCFEKKLPTTVASATTLDGFLEEDARHLFVTAKCSEPYSRKKRSASFSFRGLFEFINENLLGQIRIDMKTSKCGRYLDVKYFADGEELLHFDLKQMICHLLGIATGYLCGKFDDKQSDFVYLLYDPTELPLHEAAREKIEEIYERTSYECNLIDFASLLRTIFAFLKQENYPDAQNNEEIDNFVFKFTFTLASQDFYPLLLG